MCPQELSALVLVVGEGLEKEDLGDRVARLPGLCSEKERKSPVHLSVSPSERKEQLHL